MLEVCAIRLKGVSKAYRRFTRLHFRVLDHLGLPVPKNSFSEFWALQDIELDVPRGARLGIIGRNGAGKSTLLRLISGRSSPSSGIIRVQGNVGALMELGTGFHPDFTGLQNIRSALDYHALPRAQSARLIDDIINFTELDAVIDRPVREYSSGMYARLAFAVATCVVPQILIIDEILGAGDAYFVRKSIQRMKDLADSGATVLFVSHDMSSVQLLCDRAIWLDNGRIVLSGDTLTVAKSYLLSIREQEEDRLRVRTMNLNGLAALPNGQVVVRISGLDARPPSRSVLIGDIRLLRNGILLERIDPATGNGSHESSGLIIEKSLMNWGDTDVVNNRRGRWFGNFGGRYLHAPFTLKHAEGVPGEFTIEIDHLYAPQCGLALEMYDPQHQHYVRIGVLTSDGADSTWTTTSLSLAGRPQAILSGYTTDSPVQQSGSAEVEAVDIQSPESTEDDLLKLGRADRYGSQEVQISSFAFMDSSGRQRHTLQTGEPAQAVLRWHASVPKSDVTAVVAIYQGDGTCVMQLISKRDGFDLGTMTGDGEISVKLDPLLLGPGDYIASVALFKDMHLTIEAEAEAYDLHDRCYALKVLPPPGVAATIGIVNQPGLWTVSRS